MPRKGKKVASKQNSLKKKNCVIRIEFIKKR